jgi:hypothetical protein
MSLKIYNLEKNVFEMKLNKLHDITIEWLR